MISWKPSSSISAITGVRHDVETPCSVATVAPLLPSTTATSITTSTSPSPSRSATAGSLAKRKVSPPLPVAGIV